MRTFRDETGREWQATVGRASYGTQVLIFSRRDGHEIRQTLMSANSPLDAQNELSELRDEELRKRLVCSEEWH